MHKLCNSLFYLNWKLCVTVTHNRCTYASILQHFVNNAQVLLYRIERQKDVKDCKQLLNRLRNRLSFGGITRKKSGTRLLPNSQCRGLICRVSNSDKRCCGKFLSFQNYLRILVSSEKWWSSEQNLRIRNIKSWWSHQFWTFDVGQN